MKEFEIPAEHSKALIKYLGFSDKTKVTFLTVLKDAEIGITISDLINTFESKLPEVDIIPKLLDALISMLLTESHFKYDRITDLVSANICENDNSLELSSVKIELNRLLNTNKALILSVKGEELAFNRERLLNETRILTDVRPVFGENGSEEIKASVLLHTLRLTFYQNNSKAIEYFALDDTDLEQLKVQIERAQKKRKSVEEMLKKQSIKLIKY